MRLVYALAMGKNPASTQFIFNQVGPRTLVLLAISALVALSVLLEFKPSIELQMGILVVSIMVMGLPHGAFDFPILLRSKTPKFGLILYLGLGAAFPVLWLFSESLWLICFLAMTFVHFGQTDLLISELNGFKRALLVIARYGILFFAPAAFNYEGYSALMTSVLSVEVVDMVFGRAWFVFASCVGISVYMLGSMIVHKGEGEIEFLELLTLIVLASNFPVLLAFAVYFCFIHSLRHLGNIGKHIDRVSVGFTAAVTLATILVIVGCWLFYDFGGFSSEALFKAVRLSFSALTLPHMLMHFYPKHFLGEKL